MSPPPTITEQEIDRAEEFEPHSGHTITDSQEGEFAVIPCDWLPEVRRQLEAIVALPPGWDSYGSPSPDVKLIKAGAGLLQCLCRAERLPKPYVNPTPSGGVQFEWEAGERYFELEVVAERAATYYWRDHAKADQQEGMVFEGDPLDTVLEYVRRVGA